MTIGSRKSGSATPRCAASTTPASSWVSLEPTLDADSSLALVDTAHGFVDLFKVGRANYLPMTKSIDWREYTLRMLDRLDRLGARYYIKKDLQPYLPPGTRQPAARAATSLTLSSRGRISALLTVDEQAMAAAFEQEAAQTPGWRSGEGRMARYKGYLDGEGGEGACEVETNPREGVVRVTAFADA